MKLDELLLMIFQPIIGLALIVGPLAGMIWFVHTIWRMT